MQKELSVEEFILRQAVELVEFKDYIISANKNSPCWPYFLTEQDWKVEHDAFRASKTTSEPFSSPNQGVGSQAVK